MGGSLGIVLDAPTRSTQGIGRERTQRTDDAIEEIDIDLRDRPDRVLVRRSGFGVQCESVSPDEALALAALLAGRTLGQVSELLATNGGAAASVSSWFARWMEQRLIINCDAAAT